MILDYKDATAIAGACSQEQFIPTESEWSEIATVRGTEPRNDDKVGIQYWYRARSGFRRKAVANRETRKC